MHKARCAEPEGFLWFFCLFAKLERVPRLDIGRVEERAWSQLWWQVLRHIEISEDQSAPSDELHTPMSTDCAPRVPLGAHHTNAHVWACTMHMVMQSAHGALGAASSIAI